MDMISPKTLIATLKLAPLEALSDPTFVAGLIRAYGLVNDGVTDYGHDNRYMNSGLTGIWQEPTQFAEFLCWAGKYRPARIVEIGTFTGGTALFLYNYLERFCLCPSKFELHTIDIAFKFNELAEIGCAMPKLLYHPFKTSDDFKNQQFDLAFIDGDHTYNWALVDYNNVGVTSKLCAMHDVNHQPIREFETRQGCVGFWKDLKEQNKDGQFKEFLFSTTKNDRMGIGVKVANSLPIF